MDNQQTLATLYIEINTGRRQTKYKKKKKNITGH